jgi:nucleoside-diphosphate-sugar epimerase
MRILVAGASGAIGHSLVPMLVARGHDVTGTTRTPEKIALLERQGAHGVVMDALDGAQVRAAVEAVKPDVVVHQLTSIGPNMSFKDLDGSFAATNRLRTEGTDHLLAAAQATGVRRFVAQSFTGWPNERTGGPVKTETDPMDPNPVPASRKSFDAIRHVESAVPGAPLEGLVLRYGGFYGPGTSLGAGGEIPDMIRKRRFPIIGGGTGVWSFLHIDDAASATVAAVEGGEPGLYNITDDEPAPVSEWLPYLATALGAPRPWRLPTFLVRPMLGDMGVMMMTTSRGSSNAKARRELGWMPRFASWRDGFRTGLGF